MQIKYMKKILSIVSILLLVSQARGETITHRISFQGLSPVFGKAGEYQTIKCIGLANYGKPGAPWLPIKTVTLLLPPQAIVRSVKINDAFRELPGSYNIIPAQRYQPISQNALLGFIKDTLIYNSGSDYPADPVISRHQGNFSGYNLLSLVVCPFSYQPLGGKLKMLQDMEVIIEYDLDYSKKARMSKHGGPWVSRAAANYESVVLNYPAAANPKSPEYDLLIITAAQYDTVFQRLAQWKNQKGIRTKVAAADTVYPKYPGRDQQEKLRSFVIEQHANYGISHLLLGGDYGIIPARTAFAMHSGYEELTGKPGLDSLICDLYYSDLDGSWDLNDNGIFGEPADSVDMYPDISVGRATVGSIEQAGTFVDKVLTYEKNPPPGYLSRTSFWASYLDAGTDAALGKDMVERDYMTDYFRPVEKLYQSAGNENPASIIQSVNNGLHLINHNGHSGFKVMQGGDGWLDTTLMDTLNNPGKWGILYSLGCQAAGFDSNCIAEHFVNNPQGGGLAFIGNSRYGWYFPGFPGYSPSDLYDNTFFDQLLIQQAPSLGQAVGFSKADMIPLSQADGYFRWVNYNLNLLGDPTLAVWTSAPESLQMACPDSINTGPIGLSVSVLRNNQPAGGVVLTLYIDSTYIRSVTDRAGQATLSGFAALPQDAVLSAWTANCIPLQKDLKIVTPGPSLSYAGQRWAEISGNGDGLAGPGESGTLELLIRNNGTLSSGQNARAILRSTDSNSAVTDSLADISGLLPGDSLWTSGSPEISIDSLCRDGDIARFDVDLIDSAGNNWRYQLGQVLSAPTLKYLYHITDDSLLGNGNKIIEPGETFSLSVSLKNTGHAALNQGAFSLSTADPLIDILQPSDSLIWLAPDSSATAGFILKVDSLAPDTNYFPRLLIQGFYAGGYFSDSLTLTVGAAGLDDQIESGDGSWLVADSSYWHISSYRNFSPANSWYFGIEPEGLAPYRAVDTLLSRPFLVGENHQLSFWQWYDFIPEWGYGFIELSGSFGTRLLDLLAGSSGQWEKRRYDLSKYDPGEALQLRFIAYVDSAGPGIRSQGWFIDDVFVGPAPAGVTGGQPALLSTDRLLPNRPNPFAGSTQISFQLKQRSPIELSVYNVLGQRIKILTSGMFQPGSYNAIWDGKDFNGRGLSGGIYFVRLSISGRSLVRRMVMIK
jgi:hypothetical protein